jgi:hypothetical protein
LVKNLNNCLFRLDTCQRRVTEVVDGVENMDSPKRASKFLGFMSRTKDEDTKIAVARAKLGPLTRQGQERALARYPYLAIETLSVENHGRNLLLMGVNSIRAEVLDLVTMMMIMDENAVNLTHSAVDRFFEWLPMFCTYLERYFFVEEDVVLGAIIPLEGPLKGKMKVSSRMVMIGSIQKEAKDMMNMQELFIGSLPAGQRIGKLSTVVHKFTATIIEYLKLSCEEISLLMSKHFSKGQVDKIRMKLVKYVTGHVGTEEFLVLYTRWMPSKELLEWKTKVLLRKDLSFFSYTLWERNMEDIHFRLVGKFAEKLKAENDECKGSSNENQAAEFMRHKQAARERQKLAEPTGGAGEEANEGDGEDTEEVEN